MTTIQPKVWDPRPSDEIDDRIITWVKEALDQYQVPVDSLPLKQLQDRLYRYPDITPQALDRTYLESATGNLLLETGEASGSVTTAGVQVILDQSFPTKPAFFTASVEPDFTYTGFAFLSAYTRHDTGNGQVVISNSTSIQTVYVKWMCLRPRS